MNTADAQIHIAERLAALGFPFDGDQRAQAAWTRDGLRTGLLEQTAVSEMHAHGQPVSLIARTCGMSELRVYHHLSRGPGMYTAGTDGWRLVVEDEAPA